MRNLVGFLVAVGLISGVTVLVAAGDAPPRPIWESSPLLFVFPVGYAGRLAWRDRGRGWPVVLATAAGILVGFGALLVSFTLGSEALRPWAHMQPWLVPALMGVIASVAVAVLLGRILAERTTEGRLLTTGQALLVGMVAVGIWLGTRWWEPTSGPGLALGLVAVFGIFGLEWRRIALRRASEA